LLQFKELSAKERQHRISTYLSIVGLPGSPRTALTSLWWAAPTGSHCKALMTQPKTVLADEPTSSLDHKIGEGILQLMKEINGNFKTTFIFSTHSCV
jgi:putative ABC transport system ATP-binding protein